MGILTWKAVKTKKSCPEGIFNCPCCKKETLMHPYYIEAGIAMCIIRGCKSGATMEMFAMAMCKLRNWIFKRLIKEPYEAAKVEVICEGNHTIIITYTNLRKGCICIKCQDRKRVRIAGKVEAEECDCKIDNLGRFSGYCYICIHNNHAVLYPDSASEWDYEKNSGITPNMLAPSTRKEYWFICRVEHCKMSYKQSIYFRAIVGVRCPYCAGREVCEWNCLASTHPDLCLEWSPNNVIKPTEITHGSDLLALWICDEHEEPFEYSAKVKNRTLQECGCPKCNVSGFEQRQGQHEYFVKVANEVHNNKYKYPEEYKGWTTKIDIDCPKHNLFKQTPSAHKNGSGCPECAFEDHESHAIKSVKRNLEEMNVKYETEQTFEEMKYIQKLRIDIFILPNIAIELDGVQHFKCQELWGGKEQQAKIAARDILKDLFCVKNNINLWRIPYNIKPSVELLTQIFELNKKGKQFYASYPQYIKEIAQNCDLTNIEVIVISSPPVSE